MEELSAKECSILVIYIPHWKWNTWFPDLLDQSCAVNTKTSCVLQYTSVLKTFIGNLIENIKILCPHDALMVLSPTNALML